MDQFDRAQALELAEYERNQAKAIMPVNTQESAEFCQSSACGAPIPARRRKAVPGVQFCIECQAFNERQKR